MLLTAGTFLQEGRYWVEGILAQDDIGISYRAQHRNLEQPVIIQTLGQELCDRPDSSELLQAFLMAVRRHSQSKAQEALHVLDCFVEYSQPFVVLAMTTDAIPPKVGLWLPNLKVSPPQDVPKQETATVPNPSPPDKAPPPAIPSVSEVKTRTVAPATVPLNGQSSARNGQRPTTRVMVSQTASPRHTPRWLPTSLAFTAIIGGFTGAFFGWQLRQGKSITEAVPVVGPKIDTDQSFPPLEGWPAADPSEISGSGSGLDQVLQRRPSSRSQDSNLPLVEEPVPIEPYPINYGTSRSSASDSYSAPDYSAAPDPETAPIGIEHNASTEEPASDLPAAADLPPVENSEPPPTIAVDEPAPIEKPMTPVAPPPPPESAAPRTFNPPPAVADPVPLESPMPQ